jgi:membrane protease YdiL (CAAX protease family)
MKKQKKGLRKIMVKRKMQKQFTEKAIVYIMISLSCAFALAGAAFLDIEMGKDSYLFDTIIKCIIIIGTFAYASLVGIPINNTGRKIITPWLLVALIPFLANILYCFRIPDHIPSSTVWLKILVTVVTTAAWEELFFRYVGQSLFEHNGKYTIGSLILLALTFGCAHLINIFFYDPVSVLLQILHASVIGVFWLAIYRHTGSLWLTFVGHTLQNLVPAFFNLFPEQDLLFYTPVNIILQMIIQLTISVYILKKYGYIDKN